MSVVCAIYVVHIRIHVETLTNTLRVISIHYYIAKLPDIVLLNFSFFFQA